MNMKMGLKRTAIVAAIFWAIGWLYVAWQGKAEVEMALAEIEYLEKQYPEGFTNQYFTKMHLNAIEQSNAGSAKIGLAVRIGLFLPIVLFILSPFAWFIYRGFKPKLPPLRDITLCAGRPQDPNMMLICESPPPIKPKDISPP